MKKDSGIVEYLLWLIGCVICAYLVGYLQGVAEMQRDAVSNGAALESVDIETGEMRFEWK